MIFKIDFNLKLILNISINLNLLKILKLIVIKMFKKSNFNIDLYLEKAYKGELLSQS